MKSRLVSIGMIVFCCAIVAAAQPKVNVSGTMQSNDGWVALVDGNVYRVNDEISGGHITAITMQGITVEFDGESANYLVANAEPSKQSARTSSGGPKSWVDKLKEKFNKPHSKKAADKKAKSKPLKLPKNVSSRTVSEKMQWADRALEDFEQRSGELVNGPFQQCESFSDFKKVMSRYSRLVDENTKSFNELALPCPQTCPNNTSYVQWAKSYEQRSKTLQQQRMATINEVAKSLGLESN